MKSISSKYFHHHFIFLARVAVCMCDLCYQKMMEWHIK